MNTQNNKTNEGCIPTVSTSCLRVLLSCDDCCFRTWTVTCFFAWYVMLALSSLRCGFIGHAVQVCMRIKNRHGDCIAIELLGQLRAGACSRRSQQWGYECCHKARGVRNDAAFLELIDRISVELSSCLVRAWLAVRASRARFWLP